MRVVHIGPRDELFDDCEKEGGWNWMGSCGGSTGVDVLFVLFVVDRSTFVGELFLALGGRTYNIKHSVPF